MQIWIDADACPRAIKDILYRAAQRTRITLILVANKMLRPPTSPYIQTIRVGPGADMADNMILQRMATGDLVITADIPLAAKVIDKGGYALNPRGEMYSANDINERLSLRDFFDELRQNGVNTGGPAILSSKDCMAFANQLDRFLTRHCAE